MFHNCNRMNGPERLCTVIKCILHQFKQLYTVEPPNKGQISAWTLVHYSEVVLYGGGLSKRLLILYCIGNIDIFYV